jgi:hypothetical protein
VIRLLQNHRTFFLCATFAGLALRLFFFFHFPAITDDSRVYADLASNWLHHGIYGQTEPTFVIPTDSRLPGYPAFLAGIFWLFGVANFKAVLLAQVGIDLATCLLIADLARRAASNPATSDRTAMTAFLLAASCPFLASYSAAALTETLEIFFTVVALDCAVAALRQTRTSPFVPGAIPLWAGTGTATAACILLRPDGGILLAALAAYLVFAIPRPKSPAAPPWKSRLLAAALLGIFALAPLAPWTVRNFKTLHHFQPLAPRYANDSDELVPRGFNRWVKTWIADYVSVEEIFWNVPGETIDLRKLPARAIENTVERDATLAAIADYNESQDITSEIDARFAAIAVDRIRAHPLRYFIGLPTLRVLDMWLRPRTELLPADPRWWEFNDDARQSAIAVGFGLLNLSYVALGLFAALQRQPKLEWMGLFILFILLRSLFLGTLENPEPRYTLECYPAILVLAAGFLAGTPIPAWLHSTNGPRG